MILIADKIEKIEVRIEIDENEDHHKWSGCPRLITSESEFLFEAVDVLTVIKAVKLSETLEEFVANVEDTWGKERLATPIIRALNNKSVEKVQKDAVSVLDCAFTDENKELFDFRKDEEDCLYNAFMAYAGEYDGRFDLLTENEQVKYLVQSALADC